jgi:hypothetical protein
MGMFRQANRPVMSVVAESPSSNAFTHAPCIDDPVCLSVTQPSTFVVRDDCRAAMTSPAEGCVNSNIDKTVAVKSNESLPDIRWKTIAGLKRTIIEKTGSLLIQVFYKSVSHC